MMSGMSAESGLLAVTILAAVLATKSTHGPLAWALWLWVGVIALHTVAPLPLTPMNETAAIIIAVGLTFLTLPQLHPHRKIRTSPKPIHQSHGVAHTRFVIASVVAIGMVLAGAIAFRNNIGAATGTPYDTLTTVQIRRAQVSTARGAGFLALLATAQPILSCLGVYGTLRYHWAWSFLAVAALAVSLQTPGRTTIISLLVTTLAFYLYLRNIIPRRKQRRFKRPPGLAIATAGVAALVIFNTIGTQLGKNDVARSYFPAYWWPAWTLAGLLYLVGGLSALSVAQQTNFDPFEQFNSIFALVRLANFADPAIKPPDTLGADVNIPIPFNVFTGFGQVYFDFSIVGVAAMAYLLGSLAVTSHRRAVAGSLGWVWVSATVAALLAYLPAGYRLFTLDVVFQLGVGSLAFYWLREAKPIGQLQKSAHSHRVHFKGSDHHSAWACTPSEP